MIGFAVAAAFGESAVGSRCSSRRPPAWPSDALQRTPAGLALLNFVAQRAEAVQYLLRTIACHADGGALFVSKHHRNTLPLLSAIGGFPAELAMPRAGVFGGVQANAELALVGAVGMLLLGGFSAAALRRIRGTSLDEFLVRKPAEFGGMFELDPTLEAVLDTIAAAFANEEVE